MILHARKITTYKAKPDIEQIIFSHAYKFSKKVITNSKFSILCIRRYNGGMFSLIPIKGSFSWKESYAEITIELHANIIWYVGMILTIGGVLGLTCCLFTNNNRWLAEIGKLSIGLVLLLQAWVEGKNCVDSLRNMLI